MSRVDGGDLFGWAADPLVSPLGPVDAETGPALHKMKVIRKGM